jgi:hypothetical protein
MAGSQRSSLTCSLRSRWFGYSTIGWILSKPAQIDLLSAIKDALVTWLAEEALAGDKEVAQWVLLMTICQV